MLKIIPDFNQEKTSTSPLFPFCQWWTLLDHQIMGKFDGYQPSTLPFPPHSSVPQSVHQLYIILKTFLSQIKPQKMFTITFAPEKVKTVKDHRFWDCYPLNSMSLKVKPSNWPSSFTSNLKKSEIHLLHFISCSCDS